ncbi:MAG TPA: glycosyltransferase family 2 protein [Candidatus Limnocylindrales bacterium]|nr:glycosyltransferase family 2 protein [Candidatus Limnocylindrales bacterium]
MYKISIAIPAYNEEKNIKDLLESILKQSLNSVQLVQILVIDDGSTDDTVSLAKQLNSSIIKVMESKENLGKSERLNQIFKEVETDILVLLDADISINDNSMIENLILSMQEHRATLASGNPRSISDLGVVNGALLVSSSIQEYVKSEYNKGDNVYACHGRVLALKKCLYKRIVVPSNSVGNDAYIYFYNRAIGGSFTLAKNAIVHYKMPKSAADYAKQRKRFEMSQQMNRSFFSESTSLDVEKEYKIPKTILMKAILMSLQVRPFASVYYFFLIVISKFHKFKHTGKGWAVSESTK